MTDGAPFDWDQLYAQVVAATGWTWAEVGRLTLPRYRALRRYWDHHPPAHLLLAAWLSSPQAEGQGADGQSADQDFQTFFQELSQAGL